MQPGAYNEYVIDVNSRGDIAVSYFGLPYIFLFNRNHKLKHIIYLKFPQSLLSDNPDPKPFRDNSRQGVGVVGLISNLTLTSKGTLYFGGANLYELKVDIEKNAYNFMKAWFFTSSDPQKRKNMSNPLSITTSMVANDTVYLGSVMGGPIYKFSLH